MPIRFGASTFSYQWSTPLPATLGELRSLGLNDFDIITPPGFLAQVAAIEDELKALERAVAADGMRIESLNVPALDFNLGSLVADVRMAAVDVYAHTMRLASRLGAGGVVVVPGRVSGLLPPPARDTSDALHDSLARLVPLAQDLGLRLHVETHPQTVMATAQATLDFVHTFPEATVGVAYDIANAEFIGEDQPAAIRTLGRRLTQLHLSDGTRTAWRHYPTVDVEACLAAAEAIGFAGVAVLEIIAPDPLPAFRASLGRLGPHRWQARP